MIVHKLLMLLFPGDPEWLWRRVACMSSVIVLLVCLVQATQRADAVMVDKLVFGLLGVLGIYTGVATTADHFKRKTEGPPQ